MSSPWCAWCGKPVAIGVAVVGSGCFARASKSLAAVFLEVLGGLSEETGA